MRPGWIARVAVGVGVALGVLGAGCHGGHGRHRMPLRDTVHVAQDLGPISQACVDESCPSYTNPVVWDVAVDPHDPDRMAILHLSNQFIDAYVGTMESSDAARDDRCARHTTTTGGESPYPGP